MKIRQWLEQMQEPDRSKALKNFEELNQDRTDEGLNGDYQYMSEALYDAFVFDNTEEGPRYCMSAECAKIAGNLIMNWNN